MSRAAWCWVIAFVVTLPNVAGPSGPYAQSTASISGVVKDTDGSVMPGVSVVIKDDRLGRVTGPDNRRPGQIPGDGPWRRVVHRHGDALGLQGRHREEHSASRPGQPVSIPLTLEIGQLEETVIVTSSSELINTENGTVSATLNSDQLMRMPTPTRNALNAVAFLPGVNTTGTNRDSTINGLPESFLEHHARRREQQRQLPAQHRQLLRLRHAAAGCRRSRVGDAVRGRCPGGRRRRCRHDGVPDAVGRQPVHWQRV